MITLRRTAIWMTAALGLGAIPASAQVQAAGAPHLGPDRIYDARALLQAEAPDTAPALDVSPGGKNPKLAMLYSLVLPGLGEYYLGHTGRAKGFFVAEGAIWTSFAVFRVQGAHRRTLYKEFASAHAGVSERNDDEFYRIIGNFVSSDGPFSANEQVRRQARALYPNDPAQQQAFFDENAYTGDNAWQWESQDLMNRYQDLRSSSLDAFHRSDLSIGLLVANRLLSVIDAGILGAKARNAALGQARLSWDVTADADGPGATVTLSRAF
jgi:hypothetical protein